MKRHRIIAAPVCLGGIVLALSGGAGCLSPNSEAPDEATLVEDRRYMAELFERQLETAHRPYMHIDLTDERQYRFVRNRLLSSGNTPENSPELFDMIERARRGEVPVATDVPEAPGDPENTGSTTQALNSDWCGHFVLLEETVNTAVLQNTMFKPSAVMSCFDGASYGYLDELAFKTPDLEGSSYALLKQTSQEQYNNVRNFKVSLGDVSFGTWNDPNKMLVLDSMAIAEKNGVQHFTYATVKTVGPGGNIVQPIGKEKQYIPVPTITIEHPTNVLNSVNDPNYSDFYSGTNNTGRNPYYLQTYAMFPDTDNRIRICLERGYAAFLYGQIDCDYAYVQESSGQLFPFKPPFTGVAAAHPNSLNTGLLVMNGAAYWPALPKYESDTRYIPIKGSYQLYHPGGCSIDSYDPTFTQAQLVLTEDGGFCNLDGANANSSIGAGLVGAFSAPDLSGAKSTFESLGKFGNDCLYINGATTKTRSDLYVMVYAKTKGPSACGNRYTTKRVAPIDFMQSCFAEGTEIRRADGALLPVEQYQVGDKVVANGNGLVLTVTGVVKGSESKPLVNIYDDAGHDLFVTEMHPVVTATRGIVKAVTLVEGDPIVTDRGVTIITSINRIPYEGQVYNLALGTPEELAKAGKENRTMFAEGILVGDNEMQTELEGAPKPRPETIAAKWERDYRNDKARGGNVD